MSHTTREEFADSLRQVLVLADTQKSEVLAELGEVHTWLAGHGLAVQLAHHICAHAFADEKLPPVWIARHLQHHHVALRLRAPV